MSLILLVDDVETDRCLLAKLVQDAGHTVTCASDGDEAMTRAREFKPALILMDVVMPGLNGFNACRNLKRDPETSHIPVVLVTSKKADSDKFWSQKQGADDHIGKPFTADSVTSVIRRFLR